MRNRITLFIFLLTATLLNAQTGVNIVDFSGVDDQITAFLKTWNINGAEAAITKNGKLIYNKGFGFIDQEKAEPANPYNLYRIASVSKPITSIAIMKLIQDGKLSINDTVFGKNKILNQDYYLSVISDKRIYSITIKELLEHTSGWDRDKPCDGFSFSDPAFFPLHVTSVMGEANPVGDSTLIKFSLLKGLNDDPGTNYSYSNIGYLILGKVIEKITGKKYEDFVQKNIFNPLSVSDIHLGRNLLKDAREREAEYINASTVSSCYGNGVKVPWQYGGFNIEAMNAHGGWIATASDLTRVVLSIDGFSTFPDILSAKTIDLMSSPGSVNSYYAKGWSVNSKNSWWHTGCMDGTSSFICRTNDGYTWAFLFNSRGDDSNEFWNAFDKLPWNCLKTIKNIPDINLFPPTNNITDLSAAVVGSSSVKVSWKNGNGNGRVIVVTEKSAFEDFPLDGTAYIANAIYGYGDKLGNKTFVVYNGNGNQITITGLDPSKSYLISGFEYYKNPLTRNNAVYRLGDAEKKTITTNPVYVQDF
jgi:CubicO group peptidase (beta-lactamase class C family)